MAHGPTSCSFELICCVYSAHLQIQNPVDQTIASSHEQLGIWTSRSAQESSVVLSWPDVHMCTLAHIYIHTQHLGNCAQAGLVLDPVGYRSAQSSLKFSAGLTPAVCTRSHIYIHTPGENQWATVHKQITI